MMNVDERIPISEAPKIVVYCDISGCVHNIDGCCNAPLSISLNRRYIDDGIYLGGKNLYAVCKADFPRDWERLGQGDKLTNGKLTVKSDTKRMEDK